MKSYTRKSVGIVRFVLYGVYQLIVNSCQRVWPHNQSYDFRQSNNPNKNGDFFFFFRNVVSAF